MSQTVTETASAPEVGDVALGVRDLRLASVRGDTEQTIVAGLDLDIRAGEAVGVVGESGSGKSMTARAIMGLLPANVRAQGTVTYAGQNLLDLPERELTKIRGTELAMIFQDPFTMLNPLMRCGDQIVEMVRDARGRRLRRSERRNEAARRLAEVGIDDPAVAAAYPFELSGGMRQRVGIAAALARDPKVLIADEPSTALDVTTQKAILERLKQLQETRGIALVLITHDLRVAFSVCDRLAVLYAGSVLETGPAAALEQWPRHPYTNGLLLSEPPVDRRLPALTAIAGSVPHPDTVASMCVFGPRCRWHAEECSTARPELVTVAPLHQSACIRLAEIDDEIDDELTAARSATQVDALATAAADAGTEPLVRVTDLRKTYRQDRGGGGRRETLALRGVSIHVGAGESVGLVGESGSGKTTLGRCVVGLEVPTGGVVHVAGRDLSVPSALSTADQRAFRRTVQMIFQDPYATLNPVLSIGRTLSEALAAHRRPGEEPGDVHELLERVGLSGDTARLKPSALSGGQRQRVAIARGLAARPQLLVCDEPVSALDVSVQAQILNLLTELRGVMGLGYLFITHDLAVARQVTDRLYVLRHGEIVDDGPTADLLDHPQHPYTRQLVESVPGDTPQVINRERKDHYGDDDNR